MADSRSLLFCCHHSQAGSRSLGTSQQRSPRATSVMPGFLLSWFGRLCQARAGDNFFGIVPLRVLEPDVRRECSVRQRAHMLRTSTSSLGGKPPSQRQAKGRLLCLSNASLARVRSSVIPPPKTPRSTHRKLARSYSCRLRQDASTRALMCHVHGASEPRTAPHAAQAAWSQAPSRLDGPSRLAAGAQAYFLGWLDELAVSRWPLCLLHFVWAETGRRECTEIPQRTHRRQVVQRH